MTIALLMDCKIAEDGHFHITTDRRKTWIRSVLEQGAVLYQKALNEDNTA